MGDFLLDVPEDLCEYLNVPRKCYIFELQDKIQKKFFQSKDMGDEIPS